MAGKKLSELRVVDLRHILEKKGLEKTGIKSVLIERLSKSLSDEGLDPSTHSFVLDQEDGADNDTSADLSNDEKADKFDDTTDEIDLAADDEKMVELDCLVESNDGNSNSEIDDSASAVQRKSSVAESEQSATKQDEDQEQRAHTMVSLVADAHVESELVEDGDADVDTGVMERDGQLDDTNSPLVSSLQVSTTSSDAVDDNEEQFVVHVDESDTNLDYDLGDKPEERDAPTPTKDESMDVDADIIRSGGAADPANSKSAGSSQKPNPDAKKGLLPKSSAGSSKKETKDPHLSRNLWISGLSSSTRATDLKSVFSRHGKVVGAKVVTNANRPGAKCYGYVTMSTHEEAAKCIQNLHRTELHGRMISVDRARNDPSAPTRPASNQKEDQSAKETEATAAKDDGRAKSDLYRQHQDDKTRHRPRSAASHSASSRTSDPKKEAEVKADKTPEGAEKRVERKVDDLIERERRRLRLMERKMRDDDYKRRQTVMKEKRTLAEQTRRLRMDEARMEREREKMRLEREKVKIEEMKLETLERERARLEGQLIDLRQRVDREREELKRVETMRLEEMRRAAAMPVKRPYEQPSRSNSGRYDDSWENKRPATNDRYVSGADRRPSGTISDRVGYQPRRSPPDVDRRAPARIKDDMVDSRNSRPDDRYRGSSGSGERRDYHPPSDRRDSGRPDWKSADRSSSKNVHSNGGSSGRSSWQDTGRSRTSDRSTGSSWSGGSSTNNLMGNHSSNPPLFSAGAAVQAAGMMMSAAMSRGNNAANSRFGGSNSNSGGYSGRRY